MEHNYTITRYNLADHTTITSTSHFYTILILLDGSLNIVLDGNSHHVTINDMILFKPENQGFITNSDADVLSFCFHEQYLKDLSNDMMDFEKSFAFVPYHVAIIHSEVEQIIVLRNLLHRMTTLSEESYQFGMDYYGNCLLSSFMILFLRSCILSDTYHKVHSKKQLIIDDVVIYLKGNYKNEITLKHLEDIFFVSSEHLSRTFKKAMGVSIHQYILSLRITQAKKELLNGTSVLQLYRLCGFSNYNHFFKSFKQATGLTPIQYKNQYAKKPVQQ